MFGKGYVVQSRKLSEQQCDELGSSFKASAHLLSHANLICMFLPHVWHVSCLQYLDTFYRASGM